MSEVPLCEDRVLLVELIHALGAFPPRGGPVQEPVLTRSLSSSNELVEGPPETELWTLNSVHVQQRNALGSVG